MENKTVKILLSSAVIAVFVMMAMASSSSKDVYNGVDSFVDGWNYGKSLTSDATEDINTNDVDSIDANLPLIANN